MLSLLKVNGIGTIQSRMLLQHFKSAKAVFHAGITQLREVEGMNRSRISALRAFKEFDAEEKNVAQINQHGISVLSVLDERFPKRLTHCYDCPPFLFYKGNADLNAQRILAVVGTRSPSAYGKYVIEDFFEGFESSSITVISGLAFGIDTIAHRVALRNGLPTVGVLGHGLDSVYPALNIQLSKEMVENGGLLTEFPIGVKPDRQNFPRRNRIVAGMCDAVLVVESGEKGGSMITAELANAYNRDVFACPGKLTDEKSRGCNELIRTNRAMLVNSFDQILENMNWKRPETAGFQRSLFLNLSDEEQQIVEFIREVAEADIDSIQIGTTFTPGKLSQILLSLEMNGIINRLSGNRYRMAGR